MLQTPMYPEWKKTWIWKERTTMWGCGFMSEADIELINCQKINTFFTCGYIVGMIPSTYSMIYRHMQHTNGITSRQPGPTSVQASYLVSSYANHMGSVDIQVCLPHQNIGHKLQRTAVSQSAVNTIQQVWLLVNSSACTSWLIIMTDVGTTIFTRISRILHIRRHTLCTRSVSKGDQWDEDDWIHHGPFR